VAPYSVPLRLHWLRAVGMPMGVDQLIYASTANRPLSEVELSLLLLAARRNNESLGVTGMLLYHDGEFLQVLEGEREAVQALFGRIARDPRHTRVTLLQRQRVVQRQFADWSMGFATLKGLAESLPGHSDFLRHRHEPAKAAGFAAQALVQFRDEKFKRHVER